MAFETHHWSEDNEPGIATGGLSGKLSARGQADACEFCVQ
jgi:2,3-bisphosphoglycerate-dependent phosphoglycerate mutase